MLLNRFDQHMTPAVQSTGEYSEGEVDVFKSVLQPDSIAIEVGACFGLHTLALAELCPQGRVLALEPQLYNYQVLVANLALQSLQNVDARPCAAGKTSGSLQLPVLDPTVSNNFGQMAASGHDSGRPTEVLALSDLALPRLDLLKLDCEGDELTVLEGAKVLIEKCKPWIYMEFTDNRAGLLKFLADIGYSARRHMPHHTRMPNFLGADLTGKVVFGSDMVLAWPASWPEPVFGPEWIEPSEGDILVGNPNNITATD